MKKSIQLRWALALFLTLGIAAPLSLSAETPAPSSQLIAQAEDAPEEADQAAETNETKGTKPVVAKTKEGKAALIVVVGAVILLFVLIFVKSSKLE